ncbi:ferritin-like domain-containing protein [Schizophyllum amplum]|uniref:Ferritin-like domain-containing protein n=1 Tax=Schizophyllum amplum TaxID=97359 RepID=A0A550CQ03_9AGAR|nr:ferritin-like domain-containing protein [Auriculariopsis ampla]
MITAAALCALGLTSAVLASPTPDLSPTQYVDPPPGPAGGLGLDEIPQYVFYSDFDFQSLNLALNQEWIELDLFHHGLAMFSDEEFDEAGIDAEQRYLLQFMAEQEVGHATLIQTMLQGKGAKQCNYTYPFETVREFLDFSQKLTRWGEAGVYGFLEHLDSRAAAEMLLQSITTEARQQMIFRQMEGLFPMPIHFTTGLPQAMTWTLLSPYLVTCPAENPYIEFQIFPYLNITNNPDATPLVNGSTGNDTSAAISHNRTEPLSAPGREVYFSWDVPGQNVSYNSSYVTNSTAGEPKFAAWISQLNVTYTELADVNLTARTAMTVQPGGSIFNDTNPFGQDPFSVVNGTQFIVLTDTDLFVTPFNTSQMLPHVVAGPAVYQSG